MSDLLALGAGALMALAGLGLVWLFSRLEEKQP